MGPVAGSPIALHAALNVAPELCRGSMEPMLPHGQSDASDEEQGLSMWVARLNASVIDCLCASSFGGHETDAHASGAQMLTTAQSSPDDGVADFFDLESEGDFEDAMSD